MLNSWRQWVGCAFYSALVCAGSPAMAQQRVLGLDVSAWQGNISQTTWNNIHNVENRDFVFIRSSRGGTTGIDQRQGGFPSGNNTQFELGQRYDDLYFVQNINRATTGGLFAGPYHFARPDIVSYVIDGQTVSHTGTDEANHFIQMAGPWMRPGYLLPVFDLEAGQSQRSANSLAQFSIDFSNRIYEVMGIRPAMYINGNYSNILQNASASLRHQLAQPTVSGPTMAGPAFSVVWNARYGWGSFSQSHPDYDINQIPIQTGSPQNNGSVNNTYYGPWDDYGNSQPWSFWQYASVGRLQSFNNGNSNLDFNVAQGGIEFVKDHLVPALWMNDNSGNWSTLSNWNSGQTSVAPVPGPGQVTPVGTQTVPSARLPGAAGSGVASGQHDTVILERPNANITVTLSSGTHNIRKLYNRETLNITGGSLTINYVPSWDSTPISAQFSGPVSLTGGSLSVYTLQVDAARIFTVGGGTLAFNTINLMPHGTSPARMAVTGNANFNPLANATATIARGAGAGNSGLVDLSGGNRILNVGNGSAAVDLSVEVPIVNGGLNKAGAGTMRLTSANTYSGGTTVSAGTLLVNNTAGSGTGTGSVTVNSGTLGGTGSISGSVIVNSGGRVAPGASAGILDIGGGVTFNAGSFFDVELGGLTAGTQYDVLDVAGTATLGGTLNVSLLPGFTPTMGDSFTVLSASNVTGTFSEIVGPNVGGSPWKATYTSNSVLLSLGDPIPPPPPGPGNVIDDFEVDEGHFGWPYNASPVSQTFGLSGATTIDRVTTEAQTGIGSQELNLVSDGSASWQLRHNSGIGTIAAPAGNAPLEATGYVGFWLKTDDPGISVRLALDDPVGNTAIERGLAQDVIADNEWHLYQWNLEDDSQWTAFAGGANGVIDAVGGVVTIDSIFFAGSGNAQIFMDNVSHNPEAMLAAATVPGDYNGDGMVDEADYSKWRLSMGQTVLAGTEADGNGDGLVNAADFVFWRDRNGTNGSGLALASKAAVPEPASWILLLLAGLAAIGAYRR